MVIVLDAERLEALAKQAILTHREKLALDKKQLTPWQRRQAKKSCPLLWWYSRQLAVDANRVRRILRELLGLHRGAYGKSQKRPGLRVLAKPDGLYFVWQSATGREGRLRLPLQRATIGDAPLLDAA